MMKSRKTFLSLALAVALALLPGMTMTALADETHDHTSHTGWTGITSLSAITAAGSYYLTADVPLSAKWTVPAGTTNLCLNGKTITGADGDAAIEVPSGAVLNLYDENENKGKITNITGKSGSGVYVNGTFNMYGGTISGNKAEVSGGVYVYEDGTFTMNGGTIRDNTAASAGGGVCVFSGTFTMESGTLQMNDAICQLYYAKSLKCRLVYRIMTNMLNKSIEKGKPDLNIIFVYNMPFRAIGKMAGGMVSQEMCESIVEITNGHAIAFFKGLGGLISGFFKQKKVNKRAKEIS